MSGSRFLLSISKYIPNLWQWYCLLTISYIDIVYTSLNGSPILLHIPLFLLSFYVIAFKRYKYYEVKIRQKDFEKIFFVSKQVWPLKKQKKEDLELLCEHLTSLTQKLGEHEKLDSTNDFVCKEIFDRKNKFRHTRVIVWSSSNYRFLIQKLIESTQKLSQAELDAMQEPG